MGQSFEIFPEAPTVSHSLWLLEMLHFTVSLHNQLHLICSLQQVTAYKGNSALGDLSRLKAGRNVVEVLGFCTRD